MKSRIFSLFLILTILMMSLPAPAAQAQDPIPPDNVICQTHGGVYGTAPDGSKFCLWVPPTLPGVPFKGDLVVYAHGYVDPLVPDGAIPWDQLFLPGGISLPVVVMSQLGSAFVITSYPHNGLAVREGVNAVVTLAAFLKNPPVMSPAATPQFLNVYLVGASEGGLVTALAIEQNPGGIFNGGVTTCGPVGDFRMQVNYWGDFRVVFDYFFQNFRSQLAGPVWIQDATLANWGKYTGVPSSILQQQIAAALLGNASATQQLLRVSKAPIDSANPAASTLATVLGILDYNVRATNQARQELANNPNLDGSNNDGQPFGNKYRLYFGSNNDWLLNLWIRANDSFTADPAALAEIRAHYDTTGAIKAPLVALHDTGDPIVPYWHEPLYLLKVLRAGQISNFFTIPVVRYGHCNFTPQETIFAYVVMVYLATHKLPALPAVIPNGSQAVLTAGEFDTLYKQYSSQPVPDHFLFVPVIR